MKEMLRSEEASRGKVRGQGDGQIGASIVGEGRGCMRREEESYEAWRRS
jgi:hypothetical protein